MGRDCSGALRAVERPFCGFPQLKMCLSLNSPSSTANLGYAWLWTPPHKPPSRGMQASSGRFAPTSSARTPARVGFSVAWVGCVAMDSPSETAISGYASLLRSLRSNVVGPHTHSCRFPWDVGLQVVGAQEYLRLPNWVGMHQSPSHLCVAAPMVGASPENIGAQRLAEGGVPISGASSAQTRKFTHA